MDLSSVFDLCTLPEITDTALLHSLRQRLAAGETAVSACVRVLVRVSLCVYMCIRTYAVESCR